MAKVLIPRGLQIENFRLLRICFVGLGSQSAMELFVGPRALLRSTPFYFYCIIFLKTGLAAPFCAGPLYTRPHPSPNRLDPARPPTPPPRPRTPGPYREPRPPSSPRSAPRHAPTPPPPPLPRLSSSSSYPFGPRRRSLLHPPSTHPPAPPAHPPADPSHRYRSHPRSAPCLTAA